MRGIAHQCDRPVDPCRDRVTVDHGIFIGGIGTADQFRNVKPVIGPVLEMMNEVVNLDRPVPAGAVMRRRVVIGHLRDPVDQRQTGLRIGFRDRIDHHPVAVVAKADEG